MPWWYKTSQPSGYYHTRENFPGDPEEPKEDPGADEETKSQFTLTIP